MADLIPKGRVLEVRAKIVLPESASEDDIEDFVNHVIFEVGGMSLDNPLARSGFDAEDIEWDDTGCYRFTQITDVNRTEGGARYRMRRRNIRDDRGAEQVAAWRPEDVLRAEALSTITQ